MADFVKHLPCPECGSKDNNALYSDGSTYCFSAGCGHTSKKQEVNKGNIVEIEYRGITPATAKKYGIITTVENGLVKTRTYPYTDTDGHPLGRKIRLCDTKEFRWEDKTGRETLFGQSLFPAGSAQAITITEGEEDAPSVFQMTGSRFPSVSVSSAGSAAKECAAQFEYLNSFPKIVICFDKDEAKVGPDGVTRYPGQDAALAVAGMFPIGKVRILTLEEHKDANDYLVHRKQNKFVSEWWAAPVYTPTGLKLGKDMWDEINEPRKFETVHYPWDGFNKLTYGLRLSEVVLLTADTGVGKTQILKELEYHLLKEANKEYGVGFLHLEEPNVDTALGLMSIEANKPLHLPDVRETVTSEELRGYYDHTVNTDRVVIWDHFGSNSVQEVLNKIRHMHNLGCKYIVLDHLSIVVSDQSGDERKQLDEISTKLKTLCMELNIAVIAVIHINRQGLIRGSAGPEKIANIIFYLHRDKEDPDEWRRNVTKVVCKKNRFCGQTGPAAYLYYEPKTGRLSELNENQIKQYEAGSSPPEDERW